MGNLSVNLLPEALRTFDSSTLTGSWQNFGLPLDHPAALVKFVNTSDQPIEISWFGGVAHDIYPASSFTVYDVTANASREAGISIRKGTQFQLRGSSGTGNVYLVVLYIGD